MNKWALLALVASSSLFSQKAPTYADQVASILNQNCVSCHRAGQQGPFVLTSYEEAAKRAKLIAAVTKTRSMPPWQAERTMHPFANEARLSEEQIATLQAWAKAGAPAGDLKKAPEPPKFVSEWEQGKPDLVVKMDKPFRVYAEGEDIYRDFGFKVNMPEDKWLRAIEYRPSNRKVVHHALIYADATGKWRELDGKDGQPGGKDFPGQRRRIGTWGVGSNARVYPDGLSLSMPKGSDIIVQVHFHPTGKPEDEISEIGLYFADKPSTKTVTEIHLPYYFGITSDIDIPAGDPSYEVVESFVTPVDVEAFGAFAHAHFLGKEFQMWAELPGGEKQDLLWIKKWNFQWQTLYNFRDRVKLPKGTKVVSRITWDNSSSNPYQQFNPLRRVKWGEGTTDEMGSIALDVVAANEAEFQTLRSALRQRAQFANAAVLLRRDDALANGLEGLDPQEKQLGQAVLQFMDGDKDGKLSPAELDKARAALRAQGFDIGRKRSSLPDSSR